MKEWLKRWMEKLKERFEKNKLKADASMGVLFAACPA